MGEPMRAKGYLMLELLIVIMIMSVLTTLFIYNFNIPDFNEYIFMSEYLKTKTLAMREHRQIVYDQDYLNHDYPIIINKSGTINQAQTIHSKNHQLKINLGSGYLVYER